MRRSAVLLLALLAAGCGGESEPRTLTETRTVAGDAAEAEAEGARKLAGDLCTNLPVEEIAQVGLGVEGGAEPTAQALAEQVRPELRDAAFEGCLEALEAKGQ